MLRSSLIAAVLLAAPLAAQQPGLPLPPPQIVVSAQGESRATPDRATIFIGVQTRAATASQASTENARKQRAVLDTLRALGIPNERISTVEYNVYPEQRYDPQRGDTEPQIIGYNVVNTVRVEVHQITQLGRILDAALAKGANGINSLQFFSSNADSSRRLAMAAAVTRARADAEVLARSAGGRLGELLELSASGYESPRPHPMMARAASVEMAQTAISPGEQVVSVGVMARWRFVTDSK
jgi:uncharacterized protein YggE